MPCAWRRATVLSLLDFARIEFCVQLEHMHLTHFCSTGICLGPPQHRSSSQKWHFILRRKMKAASTRTTTTKRLLFKRLAFSMIPQLVQGSAGHYWHELYTSSMSVKHLGHRKRLICSLEQLNSFSTKTFVVLLLWNYFWHVNVPLQSALRQAVYLAIKELSATAEDVIMVTSSIMKDMQSNSEVIYRPNAIRALCKIIDVCAFLPTSRVASHAVQSNSLLWHKELSVSSKRPSSTELLPSRLLPWFQHTTSSLTQRTSWRDG